MRRLYLRIAAGVILAVVVGWAAAALSLAQLRGQMALEPPDYLAGNGLLWIAAQLDALSESLWNERLAEARPYIRRPLAIDSAADVPRRVLRSVSAQKPVFVPAEIGPPSIYMPLHAGTHFLVAGPPPPPPPPPLMPLLAGALIFVLALTATASAAVGIPLVRRLRSLQNAISELGDGNWAVRLDASAEGGLSELAESINRTAAQLQQQFQEREALLQVVSHEIGTPLSRMRFQVGMLEDEIQRPNQRNRLRALGDDLDELDELSTELVAWMEPGSTAKYPHARLRAPTGAGVAGGTRPLWKGTRPTHHVDGPGERDGVRRSAPVPESPRESPTQRTALRAPIRRRRSAGRHRRRRRRGPR